MEGERENRRKGGRVGGKQKEYASTFSTREYYSNTKIYEILFKILDFY